MTPDILALATAAKLFWSPAHVENDRPETHPAREQVVAFLQFMGLTETNAASSGATIIRPETAAAGKVVKSPYFRPTLRDLLKSRKVPQS